MNEDIRPSRISVPRQVRRVTPEDREENDQRFRRALASMDQAEGSEDGEGTAPRTGSGSAGPDGRPDDAASDGARPGIGRNLDLRT